MLIEAHWFWLAHSSVLALVVVTPTGLAARSFIPIVEACSTQLVLQFIQ